MEEGAKDTSALQRSAGPLPALQGLPGCVGGAEPSQGLSQALQGQPGAFLPAHLQPVEPKTPEPPLFTRQEVDQVKEFLLDTINNGLTMKDRLRAAGIVAKSMFPALQSVNPNINQPVTFVFQNIQLAADERLQFEQERKRRRREQRNILNGQEVIDA